MARSGIFILMAILLSFFVVIGAGPNNGKAKGSEGKGPQREFVEEVFIEDGGASHSGPGQHPTTEWDKFSLIQGGVRWHDGPDVEYKIMGGEAAANAEVEASLQEIDGFIPNRDFARNDSTTQVNPCTGDPNSVSWESIDGPRNTLGIAFVCREPSTKEITGFRVVFDTDEPWAVGNGIGANYISVGNVATHEFGHVAGLNHVNSPKGGCLTMYTFSGGGKTQKMTLGIGDKLGLDALYGHGDTSPTPGCGN